MGKIYDVIIDLRKKNSKTYLKKQTVILEPLKFGLTIPKGVLMLIRLCK